MCDAQECCYYCHDRHRTTQSNIRIHPSETSTIGLNESQRREELQLVENAVFTDPGDSSAWFYYRWLLSSCRTDHNANQPILQIIKVPFKN